MTQSTPQNVTYLPLDDFDRILLLDTLQDIINNNGELNCDLKDYLELDNNPYVTLYNSLLDS
tara:strand:- start:158 stop:343 length:186 start_codon:yes stop_codon:yes gene_type:complete